MDAIALPLAATLTITMKEIVVVQTALKASYEGS